MNISRNVGYVDSVFEIFEEIRDTLSNFENSEYQENSAFQQVDYIEFRGVSFSYPNADISTFSELNLTLEGGKKYGLIGGSGVGKSTFINLLRGNFEPSEGEIVFYTSGGNRTFPAIGYMPQSPYIFAGSILENVSLSVDVTPLEREEILSCLASLGMRNFLESLSNGLDSAIGPGKMQISGGQAQRIAIARVLFQNPEVIILDEPTSALDADNIELLNQVFSNLGSEVTLFVVAHSEDTLRNMDKILNFTNTGIEITELRKNFS